MKIHSILASKGSDVVTVRAQVSATMAAEVMRARHIGALVVIGDENRVEGMVGERDLVAALVRGHGSVANLSVRDIMTVGGPTCSPHDDVKDVMQLMTLSRSRHLPVLDGGNLVGVVSIGDMVKHRLDEMELESRVVREAYQARR
jgi:CBS domain-containing protein